VDIAIKDTVKETTTQKIEVRAYYFTKVFSNRNKSWYIYCAFLSGKERILNRELKHINIFKALIEHYIQSSVKLADLVRVIANINSTLDLEKLLASIIESAKSVMDVKASSLMLLDRNTGELIISVPTGPVKAQLSDFRIPPGKGIAGWVVAHGEPLIVPDVSVDPRFYEEVDKISGFKTKAILCVPMRNTDGEIIGVLQVINRLDGKPFTPQDINLLSEFADQAAIAIENARLYGERIHELQEAKENLVRQDKLATLGQMAGSLCHELRNSITTMRGAIYFLKDTLNEGNDEAKEYLSILDNSVTIAEKTVRDLLDFTKVKSLEQQTVYVSELLGNLLGKLDIPDNVKIEQDIPPGLPEIFVDEIQIEQVFTEIIRNAIDAMPEGGILTIRAENQDQNVHVSFTDTGCGIPAENLAKIFEPLFTNKVNGTGFGLTVAKDLTKANNGSIYVESEVGVGTRFTITLPTRELAYSRTFEGVEAQS
jgi:signal transduction histidine kinase